MMQLVVWVMILFPAPGQQTYEPIGFPHIKEVYATQTQCLAERNKVFPKQWGNSNLHIAVEGSPFNREPSVSFQDGKVVTYLEAMNRLYLVDCQQRIVQQ